MTRTEYNALMTGFGALVRKSGLVPSSRLDFALDEQKRTGFRLGQILVDHGIAKEAELYDAVARAAKMKRLDISSVQVDLEAARRIDPEWALEHRMMPLSYDEERNSLVVATTDPTQSALLKDISARFGTAPTLLIAAESELGRLIRHAYFGEPLDRMPANTPMAPLQEAKPAHKSKINAKSNRGRSLPSFPDWPTKPLASAPGRPIDLEKKIPTGHTETLESRMPLEDTAPLDEKIPLGPTEPLNRAKPLSSPAPLNQPKPLSRPAPLDRPEPLAPPRSISHPELRDPPKSISRPPLSSPEQLSPMRPTEAAASPKGLAYPSSRPAVQPDRAPTELDHQLRPLGPKSTLSAPEQLEPVSSPSLVVLDTQGPVGVADEARHHPSRLNTLPLDGPPPYSASPAQDAPLSGAIPKMNETQPTSIEPRPLRPALSPTSDIALSSLPQAQLTRLAPVVDLHQYTARAVEAIFELCVEQGIITREEYLERLQNHSNDKGSS
ncbi:MAG: hypothetical protein AAFN74_19195 [Myxococcota bacterium]